MLYSSRHPCHESDPLYPPPAGSSHGVAAAFAAALRSCPGREYPGIRTALRAAVIAALPALLANAAGAQQIIDYPEGAVERVASLEPSDAVWTLAGEDASHFRADGGALRFSDDGFGVARPDFESPRDAGGDGIYRISVSSADSGQSNDSSLDFTIRVTDRDEPGRIRMSASRPARGEPINARLSDPDGIAGDIRWRWERSAGIGEWLSIANSASYTPGAADTGHWLRVSAEYHDRLGGPRTIEAMLPVAVTGPKLLALAAHTDSGGKTLHPPFNSAITHYGIECAERDVLSMNITLPHNVAAAVNGIQPRPGRETGAAVAVDAVSDTQIILSEADGANTVYTVHCLPPQLAALRTEPDPGRALGVLLAVTAGSSAAVIDEHGVSRAHVRTERGNAGFFLRPFGSGTDLRWAHFETSPDKKQRWRVLDRSLDPLQTFAAGEPLTTTGRHDFRLLDDGSALLMTYEPAVRDFSALSFPDSDGKSWGAAVETEDSAIQWQGPDGTVRWTWNSWGRLPLEDCAQHRFPNDWAHVNSLQWTRHGILASFRGCSAIVMIDPEAASGEEIVWRIGATNLTDDDWERRSLGPAPLRIVGDPEIEFCGQHAAQLLAPSPGLRLERLMLFDNGVACVTDPHTGEPLGRQSGIYSRAVEYALDLANGEAVFVRDHALGKTRDRLGFAGGHVEPLPGGGWLVSWGGGGPGNADERGGLEITDRVTVADPDTGEETFSIPVGDANAGSGFRAIPVALDVLMRPQAELSAVFPDPPPLSHAGETLSIAVSFSRPVSAFGTDTASIEVAGGELAGVQALTAFGRPAHSYTLTVAPAGSSSVCLALRPQVGCGAAGGICAADGTQLTGVPDPVAIAGGDPADRSPAGRCA